ncbi:MAG: hypothetical protein GY737_19485 [Desulfobacteraceae bacterium]|nr:hypothetical protein [Desulfobacteraceae bacterium]
MDIFTDVYSKSRKVVQTKGLNDSWRTIEQNLITLLELNGPNAGKAKVLEDLRDKLKQAAKLKLMKNDAMAKAIVNASAPGSTGFQNRAAMLKTMNHFYLVAKKGNQSIWVVDSPKAYGKWSYDLFMGKDKNALTNQLKKRREVFGSGNRGMMSDALQHARKWSADVEVLLGQKGDKVKKTVKRWFHGSDPTEEAVQASMTTLAAGFKKIHGTCNSTRVIFSDRPEKRASGEWNEVYASVNSGDAMPVIYIYQLFLKTGKKNLFGVVPKMWLCALTVIHELSHKVAGTEDIRYDDDGLKPGTAFQPDQALKNADSWAYFAADLVGALSKGTIKRTLV